MTDQPPDLRASITYPALVAILGGGQLARMTAEAASRLGVERRITGHGVRLVRTRQPQ